ncbi:MAG: 2-oxoacid:ferredoxin oxidoreductase subunit beta, partial [Cellulomonas sp.]|nr:2-oxoacid:ferredoxin oxidoreductase subunit beta [Cellulomonas sp.]
AEAGLENLLVHDAHRDDPSLAFELSRLTDSGTIRTAPVGIFRDVERPTYDDLSRAQIAMADDPTERLADLQTLVQGHDTWTV